MANIGGKIGMKVLTIAVGIPIGIATRKLVERIWVATAPSGDSERASGAPLWADAIGWAALTAVGMAVSDLATRKAAEETFRTVLGIEPPPTAVKPKAHKKVAKAQQKQSEAIAPAS